MLRALTWIFEKFGKPTLTEWVLAQVQVQPPPSRVQAEDVAQSVCLLHGKDIHQWMQHKVALVSLNRSCSALPTALGQLDQGTGLVSCFPAMIFSGSAGFLIFSFAFNNFPMMSWMTPTIVFHFTLNQSCFT